MLMSSKPALQRGAVHIHSQLHVLARQLHPVHRGAIGVCQPVGHFTHNLALSSAPGVAMEPRPPLPPFNQETAARKVRGAEDAWNSRDPDRVAGVYTEDTLWRNRAEFPRGRAEVHAFLTRKWARELDYRLIKELWAFTDNRIAVRFAYEWRDDSG